MPTTEVKPWELALWAAAVLAALWMLSVPLSFVSMKAVSSGIMPSVMAVVKYGSGQTQDALAGAGMGYGAAVAAYNFFQVAIEASQVASVVAEVALIGSVAFGFGVVLGAVAVAFW